MLLAAALASLAPAASAHCTVSVLDEGGASSASCAIGCDHVSPCPDPVSLRALYDDLEGPAWPLEDVSGCARIAAADVEKGACAEAGTGDPTLVLRFIGECELIGDWILKCWFGLERWTLYLY